MYGIWRLFVDEEVRSFVLEGWMDSIIFVSFFSNFLMESLPTGSQKGRGFDELTTLYTNSAAF